MTTLREAAQQALEALETVFMPFHPAIIDLKAALAQQAEPVAWRLSPTDIYDFAGWLTTRPGTLVAGSKHEAGPMAEAVGEYLQTFPDRFVAPPQRKPLTDDEIKRAKPVCADFVSFRAGVRFMERKLGVHT